MYTLEQIDALAQAAAANRRRELYELAAVTRAATQAMPRDFERFMRGLEQNGHRRARSTGARQAVASGRDIEAFAQAVNAMASQRRRID